MCEIACNVADAVQHATNLQPQLGIQTENSVQNTKFGKCEPTQAAKLICKCRCVTPFLQQCEAFAHDCTTSTLVVSHLKLQLSLVGLFAHMT